MKYSVAWSKQLESSWASVELEYLDLGDARRNQRAVRIAEAMSANPGGSIPEITGNAHQAKAAYRFFDSDAIDAADIRQAHIDKTIERIAGCGVVLVAQDTMELSYAQHPGTEGLGPTSGPGGWGKHVHSAFAVSVDGVPLGLIAQISWVRDAASQGKRHSRRKRPTCQKESQRWLDVQEQIAQRVGSSCQTITLADREADIFDLLAMDRPSNNDLLIRGAHNRKTAESASVWSSVGSGEIACSMSVYIGRRDDRAGRYANLALRYRLVDVAAPRNRPKNAKTPSVKLWAIMAEEVDAPDGVAPICWLLYTTLPLESASDAVNCVCWYSYRWLIERYHYVLKSGCNIEHLQLRDNDRLERAFALYCVIAWRLLWLTYAGRAEPKASCEVALEPVQWQVLYMMTHKQAAPQGAPCVEDAVEWIGHLGGWLGRKSDGPPGVKTLWRGLRRLDDMVAAFQTLEAIQHAAITQKDVGNA